MPSTITRTLRHLSTLFLLGTPAAARHVHQRRWHQLHVRDVTTTPSPSNEIPTPTADTAAWIAAGDDAIQDIQNIQQGLSDLPGDLLEFIQSVEAGIAELKGMLSSLIDTPEAESSQLAITASSTEPLAPSTTLSAFEPTTTLVSSKTLATSNSTIAITASSISLSLSSAFGALNTTTVSTASTPSLNISNTTSSTIGQATPYETTFRTSRMTSTLVRTITISQSPSIQTSTLQVSGSMSTRPYTTGSFQGASNWTAPVLSLSTPGTLLTRTSTSASLAIESDL